MNVTLATPIHGAMDPRVAGSLMAASAACVERGIAWSWDVIMQDAIISRARNLLVYRFLKSDSDRLVFLDGDIVFEPEALLALLACEEDFVGGSYAKRGSTGGRVGEALKGGETRGELVEATHLGAGFLSLSRACLERMVVAHPDRLCRAGSSAGPERDAVVSALFDTELRDGRYVAEDYLFCERWRAIGGRCWMHPGLSLGHVGTHVYRFGVPS